MAGKIKLMVDTIFSQKANSNLTAKYALKTKLILKGIDPDRYTMFSVDDPAVISKLSQFGQELGVKF
jgi:hypothetical protein